MFDSFFLRSNDLKTFMIATGNLVDKTHCFIFMAHVSGQTGLFIET